jgi:dolichol-phosphate mannosyltransferase
LKKDWQIRYAPLPTYDLNRGINCRKMPGIVVIPTYNEANNIEKLLDQIFSLNLDLQVIVVDDSSEDGTADIVENVCRGNNRVHLIRRMKRRSFGESYKDGFENAFALEPEYIIQMDADLSHPPEFIHDFLAHIHKYDLIIGSRYTGGIRILNWSIKRLILSILANKYVKTLLGLPFEDCTSGFRCWNARALKNIHIHDITSNGYAFLVEMAYIAFKKGYKIAEIPIIFTERENGVSKMSMKLVFESGLLPWRLLWGHFTKIDK